MSLQPASPALLVFNTEQFLRDFRVAITVL